MKQKLLFLLFAVSANILFATTYTVSTVSELHNAVDNVVPGDEIIMTDGTWTDAQITLDTDGTAANPITIRAQTPGAVIITGNVRFRIGGDYLIVSGLKFENCISTESNLISFRQSTTSLASHSRLTDCMIINCNPPDSTTDYKWVGIFGNDNEVDHCYISGKNHEGTTLVVWSQTTPGNHHIHHNYFGPRPEGDGNGWETIRIGTSSFAEYDGFNMVEHNYFYQTDGEIEIISGKSSNSTYRYNIFRDCKGGLTLRHGSNCLVEGNIFFGENKSGSYGVRVIDRDHVVINNYFEGLDGASSSVRFPIVLMNADATPIATGYQHVINATVAYNTIVNCTKAIMVGATSEDRPFAPEDCNFFNNVVTIDNYAPVVHSGTPTNPTYTGNFFHRTDASVSVPTSGFVNVDPQLSIPASDSIYRPAPSSPIVAAAVTGLTDESIDFEGQSRPASPAAGADEISTDPVIDRGVYGPTWLASNIVLPTELVELSVRQLGSCAKLFWRTANEEQVENFYIMRSLDGINFTPIGQQTATGNGSENLQTYSFDDCEIESLRAQKIYYLLHIVDQDGSIQRSQIVILDSLFAGEPVRIFNQADNQQVGLYFPPHEAYNQENVVFSVYNVKGNTLIKKEVLGNGETVYFGRNWTSGQYLIQCQYPDGRLETLKWMKY